jgi:hypothetical protein
MQEQMQAPALNTSSQPPLDLGTASFKTATETAEFIPKGKMVTT